METFRRQKNKMSLLFMACMIMPSAIVFGVTGDAPQTVILALMGLVLSAVTPRPLDRTTRSFVYMGLSAIVTAVISDQIFPVRSERFFLLPAELYCPMVIYLAVALTFFDQRDSNVAAIIGLSLVAMMMAGNVLDFSIPHERLPITEGEEEYVHGFFAIAVTVQLLACIALLPRAPFLSRQPPGRHRQRSFRLGLITALVLISAGITLALRVSAQRYEHVWQGGFIRMLQRTMLRSKKGAVFGSEIDLWRTVPFQREHDGTIALRVLARETPGYLRGRIYHSYDAGRWSSNARTSALPEEQAGDHLSYSMFRRIPTPGRHGRMSKTRSMDLLPSGDFRSDVLFAPGSATGFEIIAQGLSNTPDGELTPSDWEPRVGYMMTVADENWDHGYPGPILDRGRLESYLQVPDVVLPVMKRILTDALGNDSAALSTPDIIARITRYLDRTCRYQLGVSFGPRTRLTDPVNLFLTHSRRGHCELFASAAALLLRADGIPTRYVTGIVCHERIGRSHWVARLMDLHAWCEAYDVHTQTWIRVEATPAAGLPGETKRFHPLGGAFETLSFFWQHIMALLKRGTIAEAILTVASVLVRMLGRLFWNPVGGPLGLLSLFGLCFWWWRHHHGLAPRSLPFSRERVQLTQLFQQTVRHARRWLPGLPENPTPAQLEQTIAHRNPLLQRRWQPILKRYEVLRFGPGQIRTPDLEAMRKAFRENLRALKKMQPSQSAVDHRNEKGAAPNATATNDVDTPPK